MKYKTLYEEYHLSRSDERLSLFEKLISEFGIQSGLYPGCFVHVTPSFVIPRMVYVDSDKRANKFFGEGAADELVSSRKIYSEQISISFFHQDYAHPLPIDDRGVDLLISQYAGFVSESCKRYLKVGGYLVANNSHGDAGLANCDQDFDLVAVCSRRGEKFSITTDKLDEYFIPKSKAVPEDAAELQQYLKSLGRGIGYTKSPADYVFRRV